MSPRGPEVWTKGRLKSPHTVAEEIIETPVQRAKNPPDTRLYDCGGIPVEVSLPNGAGWMHSFLQGRVQLINKDKGVRKV